MTLIIVAHPDSNSFTATLGKSVQRSLQGIGRDVEYVDLYRVDSQTMCFPPILQLEELQRKTSLDPLVQRQMGLVEEASEIIIIHPDWWGGPPGILKGWIDRVLRPETAYATPMGYGRQEPYGLLTGCRVLVVVPGDANDPGPLKSLWEDRIWGFCGADARLIYLPRISERERIERSSLIEDICGETIGYFTDSSTDTFEG